MKALTRKKGVFNFINDVPLNFKFLMIYILCVFVPIFTTFLIFWNRISNDIKDRETENYNISINRVNTDFLAILDGCVDVSHSISTDKDLYTIMERHFTSNDEYYEVYNDLLRDRINRYLPIYSNVSRITLYTYNETIVSGGNYFSVNQSVRNADWYKEIVKAGNKVVLYAYRDKSDSSSEQYLSVLRQLDEYPQGSGNDNQIIKIDINMNKLYNIFEREKDYLDLFLVDPEGRIICSIDRKYEQDLSKDYINFNSVYNMEGNTNVLKGKLGTAEYLNGWNIVGIPNQNRILYASRHANIYIACIIFAVTLIASLLIWVIVSSYNYRVKKLLKHIKGVGNQNFALIDIEEGKDEIGELVLNFNMMTTKINTLINDVYKLQIKRKDLEIQRVQAELNFLQSQVDPHFLFNTLNAVMAVCVRKNYTDLTDVIKYLSKLFRRLISWKDDLVTVSEEISFTDMYLRIEKFRFLDKFDYTIEADDEALNLKVPKMSIQTLVENSCKHGIQNSTDIGIVKIRVILDKEYLNVFVEDNGAGIEENKLRDIIDDLQQDDEINENVGIRNVYKRLRLYYGNDVQFDIKSEMDKGTIVHYGININAININKSFKEKMC